MRAQLSTHDYEQLSAYLDGQLASGDRTKLEARLKTRPELQAALEDLRQTRALLRMAPRKRAPRNFTLTPAMVGAMPPARKAKRWWGDFNLFPALSFASAMAALLLVAVILFDFGPFRQQAAMQAAPNPAATSKLMVTQAAAAPAAPAAGGVASGSVPAATPLAPAANDTAGPSIAAVPQAKATGSGGVPGGVINWVGATGRGGGGGGGPAAGASLDSRSAIMQQYGVGGSGQVAVPPQSVQSLPAASAQAESQPQPAQPDAQITGTGPILGVPQQDQAGKVTEQQGLMGNPDQVTPGPTEAPAVEPTVVPAPQGNDQPYSTEVYPAAPEPWYARTVAGLPALRLIEGGLLVVVLATGIAALILWRQRS